MYLVEEKEGVRVEGGIAMEAGMRNDVKVLEVELELGLKQGLARRTHEGIKGWIGWRWYKKDGANKKGEGMEMKKGGGKIEQEREVKTKKS